MTTREAMDEFFHELALRRRSEKTIIRSNNELRQFCVFVRNKPIEEVTRSDIKEWIELQQIALFSEGAIQNKCGTLRVFFRFLRDIGKNVVNPDLIPMFTVERSIPRIPDEQELIKFEKVLLSCKDPNYLWRNLTAYWLPRQGGLRVGELLSLKKSNLDLPNMRGLVRTEKKRGGVVERQFFWEDETQTVLSEWIAIRDSWGFDTDDLFITRTGKKWQETGLYVTFQRASKKAGVRMVNPHSLRHFFARDKALKGAEDSTIASLLGHKDIRSSYIYTQLFGTRLETAYRALQGESKAQRQEKVLSAIEELLERLSTIQSLDKKESELYNTIKAEISAIIPYAQSLEIPQRTNTIHAGTSLQAL